MPPDERESSPEAVEGRADERAMPAELEKKAGPLVRFADRLKQSALLDALERLASLSVLVAVVMFFAERGDRRKQRHFEAWQVVASSEGHSGSGGRIEALEELARDGVSLAGVNLSHASLPGLNLAKSNLGRAVFDSADLTDANFVGAKLQAARFVGAKLQNAVFDSAQLAHADFRHAQVLFTTFRSAELNSARFDSTVVMGSFQNASMGHVSLRFAFLIGADFSGAKLGSANLYAADLAGFETWRSIGKLSFANIQAVSHPPAGFVRWASDTMSAVCVESEDSWHKLLTLDGVLDTATREGSVALHRGDVSRWKCP